MQDSRSLLPAPFRTEASADDDGRASGKGWWALAAASVFALIVVMIVIAQTAWAPRTPWDENGIFQLARVFAGEQDVPLMMTRGYYPGTSLLVAPLYWFTDDPLVVYPWANFITNMVAFATILPLTGIVRRIGLSLPQAITVSALTLCLPGFAGLADYALSEQLLGFLIVLATLGIMRFWQKPSWGNGGLVLGASLGAVFTHPRALLLVAVVAVWLIGVLFDRTRRRPAGLLLIVLVPTGIAVKLFADHLASLVLIDAFSQGNSLFNALASPDILLILKIALLQSWSQILGSMGILAFGVVMLVAWAWVELVRNRHFGPGVFIFGLTLAGAALSWVNWATPSSHIFYGEPRFDSWVYTRYIAPFATVAIAMGLAALILRLPRAKALSAIIGTSALSLAVTFVIAETIPLWGAAYGPGNIAAIRAWDRLWPPEAFDVPVTPTLTNETRFWLVASLAMLVGQMCMVIVSRFPRLLAATAIPVVALYALAGDENMIRETPDGLTYGLETVEQANGGEELSTISWEIECNRGNSGRPTTINWLGFWFSPREVDIYYSSSEDPESLVVVACNGWDGADDVGAAALKDASDYGYEVYVMPGPVQDDLRAQGLTVD